MQDHMASSADRAIRQAFADLLSGQRGDTGAAMVGQEQSRDASGALSDEAQPEGVYIISVAARILSMHPQTLRKYERVGLVRPSRTVGMLRLYSNEDITKLRVIKRLVDELKLNLAGVEMAMAVFERVSEARRQMVERETAEAFQVLFDQIMELFQGPPRQFRTQADED